MLYAAKILNQFLFDVEGPVKSLLMECLIPKVGSGTKLKAAPSQLQLDISEFSLKDIINGPLETIPENRHSKTYIVPKYEELKVHLETINKDINGSFQKFQMWHLKDRKFIFYVKGKDEIMKMEIIKERDKGFMCQI